MGKVREILKDQGFRVWGLGFGGSGFRDWGMGLRA